MTYYSAIPFHIVSGFLGSGKTTFMKEILSQLPEDQKTGIIQNEFAPVNVDGAELNSSGKNFRLLEINNGSVFCVCLLGDFVTSLNEFIDCHSPDLIILEASGLSDTTSIAEILSHPLLLGKIYLAANWCVVDAVHFRKHLRMQQRINHQVRMADVVLINKTDLADGEIPELTAAIKAINPFAEIYPTTWCQIPFHPEKLPGLRFMPMQSSSLSRPDIHSMVLKTTRTIKEEKLKHFLGIWSPLAYRIKGYVRLDEDITVSVQCVSGQVEIRPVTWWPGPTELIALTDQFTLREWNRSFGEILKPD